MISIIIPTLNEEKYLPKLLVSIKRQARLQPANICEVVAGSQCGQGEFGDCEIIVADAGSGDQTVEIAKAYGCRVVKGGLPAFGRNRGAEIANGALLLFLDADVVLPEGFLARSVAEYEKRQLKIASFLILPEPRTKKYSLLADLFYNTPIRCLEHLLPHAAMAILIERALFETVGGFDEAIKIAEDHDLARRAAKLGKYGLIKAEKISVSTRRYEKDGFIKTHGKNLLAELYMIFKGPVRKELFEYQFSHYELKRLSKGQALWRRLRKKVF